MKEFIKYVISILILALGILIVVGICKLGFNLIGGVFFLFLPPFLCAIIFIIMGIIEGTIWIKKNIVDYFDKENDEM